MNNLQAIQGGEDTSHKLKPNQSNKTSPLKATLIALAVLSLIAACIYLEVKYHAFTTLAGLVQLNPIVSFAVTLCVIGIVILLVINLRMSKPKQLPQHILQIQDPTQHRNENNVLIDIVPIFPEVEREGARIENSGLGWYMNEYPNDIEEQKQRYLNAQEKPEYLRCSNTYVLYLKQLKAGLSQRTPAINSQDNEALKVEHAQKLIEAQRAITRAETNNYLLVEFARQQAAV